MFKIHCVVGNILLLLRGFFVNLSMVKPILTFYLLVLSFFPTPDAYHSTPVNRSGQVHLRRVPRRQKSLFLRGTRAMSLPWRVYSPNTGRRPFQSLRNDVDEKEFKEVEIYKLYGSTVYNLIAQDFEDFEVVLHTISLKSRPRVPPGS